MKFVVVAHTILLTSLTSVATAQFAFFDHMFRNQGEQQSQQQAPQTSSQWSTHAQTVSCSSYLCPESLVCVPRPIDCPCPRPEDIKCVVPDTEDTNAGTVVCISGTGGCTAVERLAGARWQ